MPPFEDIAAIMANLDLVITLDTAIAHLAGALARPTWIAVKQVPDWRLGLQAETTPWYPTVRLFRQSAGNAWASAFDAIHAALAASAKTCWLRLCGSATGRASRRRICGRSAAWTPPAGCTNGMTSSL